MPPGPGPDLVMTARGRSPRLALLGVVACVCLAGAVAAEPPPTPEWAKDLVIYEIATKGFTSPNGPESGTFRSAAERLPYLADLGITGIWLSGHNLAAEDHYYGIWTQYATIRPDVIDPSLGTGEDLTAFVDEAHRHGIRVFLDVTTHGVVSDSPLIGEHPDWFRGGSWGMTDYDWEGGRAGLEDWWVRTFTDYVVEHGIDGYRLDGAIYRTDLWLRIKENAAQAGHPIVVFLEGNVETDGVSDFRQRLITLSVQTRGLDMANPINSNVAELFLARYGEPRAYVVRAYHDDGSFTIGTSNEAPGFLDWVIDQVTEVDPDQIHRGIGVRVLEDPAPPPSNVKPEGRADQKLVLEVSGLDPARRIERVTVGGEDPWEEIWSLESRGEQQATLGRTDRLVLELEPLVPDVKLLSVQLSSHDDGWDSSRADGDANAYVAEGSRCVFGYSVLFTPAIPLFMSGEEFAADFVPLPRLTPDLYGQGERGTGIWLYGSWLHWDQLQQPDKAAMHADVRKMISIRKAESDLLHAASNEQPPQILALAHKSSAEVPVPYVIWNDEKALLVAGNRGPDDVAVTVTLPDPLAGRGQPVATDLWGAGPAGIAGRTVSFSVRGDGKAGGGIAVQRLEWPSPADGS